LELTSSAGISTKIMNGKEVQRTTLPVDIKKEED